jgi:hypothetical protein
MVAYRLYSKAIGSSVRMFPNNLDDLFNGEGLSHQFELTQIHFFSLYANSVLSLWLRLQPDLDKPVFCGGRVIDLAIH